MYICAGHNPDNLVSIAVTLRQERPPASAAVVVTSDGVTRPRGGLTTALVAETLEPEEGQALLVQLGLGENVVSTPCCVTLVSVEGYTKTYIGVVTLDTLTVDVSGWWTNFRLNLTQLVAL